MKTYTIEILDNPVLGHRIPQFAEIAVWWYFYVRIIELNKKICIHLQKDPFFKKGDILKISENDDVVKKREEKIKNDKLKSGDNKGKSWWDLYERAEKGWTKENYFKIYLERYFDMLFNEEIDLLKKQNPIGPKMELGYADEKTKKLSELESSRKTFISYVEELNEKVKKWDKEFFEPVESDWVVQWEKRELQGESSEHLKDYKDELEAIGGELRIGNFRRRFHRPVWHYQIKKFIRHFKIKCPACHKDWIWKINTGSRHNSGQSIYTPAEYAEPLELGDGNVHEYIYNCVFCRNCLNSIIKNMMDKSNKDYRDASDFIHQSFSHIRALINKNLREKGQGILHISGRSNKELLLAKIVESIFPNEELIFNTRTILDGYELDIYLPRLRLAIEYNGEQHYNFIKAWHKDMEGLERVKQNDKEKEVRCKKFGIKFITVRYDEPLTKRHIQEKIEQGLSKVDVSIFSTGVQVSPRANFPSPD